MSDPNSTVVIVNNKRISLAAFVAMDKAAVETVYARSGGGDMSQPLPVAQTDPLPAPLADLLEDAATWPAKLRTMTEIVVAEAHRLQAAGDARGALRLIELKGLQLDRFLGEAPGDEAKLDAMIADGIDAAWLRIAINCYARAAVALGAALPLTPHDQAHVDRLASALGLA